MDEFSAVEAAKWLGVSREAVDLAAREGRLPVLDGDGPRRFSRETLEAYHQARVGERVAKLARDGETPASVAQRVRRALHSSSETGLPRSFASRLAVMPVDWRNLFNKAELAAACVPEGEGCRWCEAAKFSAFLGLRPLEYAKARVELFGGPPCLTCGPGLMKPFMEALEARVHPGRHRPPDARAEAAAAVPPAPRLEPVQRAQPFQGDDDGRALISRRRREVQTRLKAARRSGDTKYALRLQQQLQSLTADASVVDGRAASAARPGTLRCGHALAAGCSCPRRASTRGQR
ncbi:helix-turn-helix domain-containing protein [Streptomyces flaveus]|uniref:Helix-turn-helix domain-containing protein n=1 Tax=Streptomyces flaveus TaxID=66370 RepID=A0A917QSD0_9ACTN|nr:helix-turn-helix domain-containing protein [Streptomyces flaveus]GGK65501.1 hypothetical protein GCM10010094_28160 [Streptomyces flaveus]